MSRPIYEPSLPRADAELGYGNRQLFRRPAPGAAEGEGILPTFRATIEGSETDRRAYPSDADSLDTVFWTHWDNGSPTHYDPFVAPSGPDIGKLGAVELLVDGVYLIFCRLDWDDNFEGEIRMGANYDDSPIQTKLHQTANAWYGPDGFSETRLFTPDYTGAQVWVEIVLGQTNPGAADHFIWGGFFGFWAMPPELLIVYLGDVDTADNFMTFL